MTRCVVTALRFVAPAYNAKSLEPTVCVWSRWLRCCAIIAIAA